MVSRHSYFIRDCQESWLLVLLWDDHGIAHIFRALLNYPCPLKNFQSSFFPKGSTKWIRSFWCTLLKMVKLEMVQTRNDKAPRRPHTHTQVCVLIWEVIFAKWNPGTDVSDFWTCSTSYNIWWAAWDLQVIAMLRLRAIGEAGELCSVFCVWFSRSIVLFGGGSSCEIVCGCLHGVHSLWLDDKRTFRSLRAEHAPTNNIPTFLGGLVMFCLFLKRGDLWL